VLGYDITDAVRILLCICSCELFPSSVFEISLLKQGSFANISTWKFFIERNAPSCMHKNVVLVGHKCDLDEKRRVTAEQGKELADANG
jgi:hypothetical protein